jgi:hypothetical protein
VVESLDREAEIVEEINSTYSSCCNIALTMSERKSGENSLKFVDSFPQGRVLSPNGTSHFAFALDGDLGTDAYRL